MGDVFLPEDFLEEVFDYCYLFYKKNNHWIVLNKIYRASPTQMRYD